MEWHGVTKVTFKVTVTLSSLFVSRCLMSYHDWLEQIGRGRPSAFEVSNMEELKEIFNEMKLRP